MKTIADFKRRLKVGVKMNSKLLTADKNDRTKFILVVESFDRVVTMVQSNSFALGMNGSIDIEKSSWSNWPKKDEFKVINNNEIEVLFGGGGKLIYTFVE